MINRFTKASKQQLAGLHEEVNHTTALRATNERNFQMANVTLMLTEMVLKQAIDDLGVFDVWGMFYPYTEQEIDVLVQFEDMLSLAKCAIGTHKQATFRFQNNYYSAETLQSMVEGTLKTFKYAAFKRFARTN